MPRVFSEKIQKTLETMISLGRGLGELRVTDKRALFLLGTLLYHLTFYCVQRLLKKRGHQLIFVEYWLRFSHY